MTMTAMEPGCVAVDEERKLLTSDPFLGPFRLQYDETTHGDIHVRLLTNHAFTPDPFTFPNRYTWTPEGWWRRPFGTDTPCPTSFVIPKAGWEAKHGIVNLPSDS